MNTSLYSKGTYSQPCSSSGWSIWFMLLNPLNTKDFWTMSNVPLVYSFLMWFEEKTRHNRLRTEKPRFLFLLKGTNCLSLCLLRNNSIGGHGHWYKQNSTCANKRRKASRPRLIHSLVDAKKSQDNYSMRILNGFFVELHDLILAQKTANI